METQPSCVWLSPWDQALPPEYPEMPSLSLSGPVAWGAQPANRQLPAGGAQHRPTGGQASWSQHRCLPLSLPHSLAEKTRKQNSLEQPETL